MEEKVIRVMIVEDDRDFVYLIRKSLDKIPEISIVSVCTGKEKAVKEACRTRPDIVLMDLNLGNSSMDGILASREIRILTDARILILTADDSPDMVLKAAKEAFASGYLFKNQMYLLAENIMALWEGYTAQEYLIASAALSCLSEAEMAVFQIMMGKEVLLRSSPKTKKKKKTRILKKLGLENQKELRHIFRLFQEK